MPIAPAQSDEPKWKLYERVRASIEKSFGDCGVTYDHKVKGRRSGVERQVDVWLSASVGDGHAIGIAIECKHRWPRPVDIQAVDALYGFIDDVGAVRGVLISNSGFTEGALARADGANVSLRHVSFEDAERRLEALSTPKLKVLTVEEVDEFDWDELVDVQRCEVSGCWGEVRWEHGLWELDDPERDEAPDSAGFCGSCHSFHIECGNCGEVSYYEEEDEVTCDSCEQSWELNLDRKGAGVISICRKLQSQNDDDDEDDDGSFEPEP